MDYWNHTLESSLASPHVKRQIQYGQTHDRIEDSLTFEKEDYFQDFFFPFSWAYAECAFFHGSTMYYQYYTYPGLDTTLWAGTWKGHVNVLGSFLLYVGFSQMPPLQGTSIFGCIFGIPDSGQVPVKLYDKPVDRDTPQWSFGLEPGVKGHQGPSFQG